MKSWIYGIGSKLNLIDTDAIAPEDKPAATERNADDLAVKIKKCLITPTDIVNLEDNKYVGLTTGSGAVGVISEDVQENLSYKFAKAMRVYITPYRPCDECVFCKKGSKNMCADLKIAGEDYDGYLTEFCAVNAREVYPIPDGISDNDALFIETVSLALTIIDRMNIQKGEHVAIIGANNLGLILAQLLRYYQNIPIVIDNNPERLAAATACGIYYTVASEKDAQKEVSNITGGRMASQVVYIQESRIPLKTAFLIAGFNANVAITGSTNVSSAVSFAPAIKKELKIQFVNTGYGNVMASINLIVNKAVDFSKLFYTEVKFNDCGTYFDEMMKKDMEGLDISDAIVKMNDV